MPKKLLSPEAARDFLVRRFRNQHQSWLMGEGTWPLTVNLGIPTEKDIAEDAAAVRAWASAWQSRTEPGEVVFEDRQFARLGRHRLPVSLSMENAGAVAKAVGESRRWEIARDRYRQMVIRWPVMAQHKTLASWFDVLADYSSEDFKRLVMLLAWLEANPKSDFYLRQLPVEGLDTKWLERRTSLVADLLRSLREVIDDNGDVYRLFGLRKPEHRIRLRILCPTLRQGVGGLSDIEAPVAELAALPIVPKIVVVVENLATGLALPDLPGTVAIMRLGNAVSALEMLRWLPEKGVMYWGDIDTHGFAILDRARRVVPQLQSILMDEEMLLSHRPYWGREPSQCPDISLDVLTESERSVYNNLRANRWEVCVRLEQERLNWGAAMETLKKALAALRGEELSAESVCIACGERGSS